MTIITDLEEFREKYKSIYCINGIYYHLEELPLSAVLRNQELIRFNIMFRQMGGGCFFKGMVKPTIIGSRRACNG